MSRPAFGADRTMSLILELVGDSGNRLESPLSVIGDRAKLGALTIKKYLIQLSDENFVELVWGGHGNSHILYLLVLKREVPVRKTPKLLAPKKKAEIPKAAQQAPAEVAVKATPVTPAIPVTPVKPRTPTVIVLVDYDNVVGTARENSFSLSFAKLKEFVRKSGKILFADVFISPKAAQRPENVMGLWQAGFNVIACPMGSKDKDAVDSKINWRARQYLECTTVDTVIIASRDQDFSELADFARDMHKVVKFLDVNNERLSVEGEDALRPLVESRTLGRFGKVVDSLAKGFKDHEDEQGVEFVKAIIRAIAKRKDTRPMSFEPLKIYVWLEISQEWSGILQDIDLKVALTALIEADVIKKNTGNKLVYYTLNQDHPATRFTMNH